MPVGHYDQEEFLTPQRQYNTPHYADESTASILKSVKAQEVHFERLTRELEAERQSVARQANQYRDVSDTASMNSISTTDDSFNWRSPHAFSDSRLQDESLGLTNNSHLLDSCLRELEHRDGETFGRRDNMDYNPGGPMMYDSYNPGPSPVVPNGGPSQYIHDDRSPHGSRMSLHSTGSNRPRGDNRGAPGSMGSLHRDHPHDNYASYPALSHHQPYVDDHGSPHSPGTPTRDARGSYDRPPSAQGQYPYGSNQHMDDPRYGGPPMLDHYGEQQPNYVSHDDHPAVDSFYQDSPDRYNPQHGANDPDDSYNRSGPMDNCINDPSYLDDRYRGHPDDSIPDDRLRDMSLNDPHGEGLPPDYRYGDEGPPGDRYNDHLRNDSFDNRQPNDRYSGAPTYGDYDDSPYRKHEGLPAVHSDPFADDPFQQKAAMEDDRYRGMHPGDDSYRDEDPYHRGPPVEADDRYRDDDTLQRAPPHDGRMMDEDPYSRGPPPQEDPYNRGPPPQEDPYNRGPPPQEDPYNRGPPMQEDSFSHGPPPDDRYGRDPHSQEDRYHEDPYNRRSPSLGHGGVYDDDGRLPPGGYYDQDVRHSQPHLNAPPNDGYSDGRRTPSIQGDGGQWRAPDIQEVIDYLNYPSDNVKANAAAYLQHLCYNDDDMKAKARGLGGIPPLIELLNSDYPEVQRNACGALKNLSFGKGDTGTQNKKQIENAGGITALIRLLRRTKEEEVKELVTGILWNLSSSDELKPKIIAEGLPEIVSRVIVPYSGWEQRSLMQAYEPWTTVYRNATGIIRNLSSANKDDEAKGYDTRNRLRQCSKLVNCLVYTLKISKTNKDRENKPVENCTCALRNLSFRIQEVVEQDFYKKRTMTLKKRQQPEKKDSPGCFGGGGGKKKGDQKGKGKPDLNQNAEPQLPPGAQEFQGLWQPEVVSLYIDILKESSNPVTVEAAAGAIQNLTACYWKYAEDIRSLVRKEKGLPALVDLLGQERDSVVCHSALALRNLAIDEKNKELIGKYAMKQITFTLPLEKQKENVPDKTICAVVALLHEVVKNSVDFAQLFTSEGGIPRLKFIKFSRGKFLQKTKVHTQTLLNTLWEFKTLHSEYATYGITEREINAPPSSARMPDVGSQSGMNTPYSTMSRPMESQGYDDNTLSPGQPMNKHRQPMNGRVEGYQGQGHMVQGHSNPAMNMDEAYNYDDRRRGEDIPMTDIAPGYAPLEERRDRRPPVGGVPLFPNLQPQSPGEGMNAPHGGEPLYAQVNKNKRRDEAIPPNYNHVTLDEAGSPQGGADSWV